MGDVDIEFSEIREDNKTIPKEEVLLIENATPPLTVNYLTS